jgi:hypothetical protein
MTSNKARGFVRNSSNTNKLRATHSLWRPPSELTTSTAHAANHPRGTGHEAAGAMPGVSIT